MPKFHLPLLPKINISNDYHIEIDKSPYNENKLYFQANSISFKNKYGYVELNGFFNLADKNIPSLINIDSLSFEISNQILDFCSYNFCKYKEIIQFYFSYDDNQIIKNIENILKKEFNCEIDYNKGIIYILMNELKNININQYMNYINNFEEEKEEIFNQANEYNQIRNKIKDIDEDMGEFEDNKIYSNKNENDENNINRNINENNIKENYFEDSEIENNSKIGNIFTQTEKSEEIKMETVSEHSILFQKKKTNFIKYSDINNIIYDKENNNKNYVNKVINPIIKKELKKLITNGKILMKKNSKENILNNFNINGMFLLLNKNDNAYGNNYNLVLNKININNDISNEKKDNYNKIIYNNYINILDKVSKDKKNNELLNLNDYTYITLNYISQIENEINKIEKNNIIDVKCLEKYKKISSILKLFCILFLNCFIYKPKNEYLNDKSLFTDSFSDKVMSYRKRLLIEWCIDEQKYCLDKNIKNLSLSNQENNIKSNYQKLYSYGQIKQSVEEPKKRSLFMRAKMAINTEKIAKNNMNYFTEYNAIYGDKNRKFNDIFVDNYKNDWVSFLAQSLLYEEKKDEYIIHSIELLSKNINNMKNDAKPEIKVNNNIIYDINFILLKLYEQYIKGNIDGQIKYLKMISYSCNINNNKTTDHFIHYIICSTLLNIIEIIFPKDNDVNREITDKIFIKKLTYNLLIQSVEELLLNISFIDTINKFNDYIFVIKLIMFSFLNKKIKNKIVSDIISKITISKDILNFFEENNPLNLPEKEKNILLGYINNTLSLWKNAYNYFINAKKYKLALDACVNYSVEYIKKYKEKSDFKEIYLRLEKIKKNSPSLFSDVYQILYLFVKYLSDDKNNYQDEDVIINEIMNKIINKDNILSNDLLDDEIKGIIIDLMYKKLIKIKTEDKITTGNCELLNEKFVRFDTKLNILNNILDEHINYKNIIFHK